MRPITMLQSQFKIDNKEGESLHFEKCKGGYFSSIDEYGLKVVGKTLQDGTPSPEKTVPIQCVKQGTRIICGNEITVPCDLYEDDIWYPASGYVIKNNEAIDISKEVEWWEYNYPHEINPDIWCYVTLTSKKAVGYQMSKCNGFVNFTGAFGKYSEHGAYSDHPSVTYTYFISNIPTLAEFREWLAERSESNDPVILVYKLANPIVEQYEPQYLFAPRGTADVTQNGIELTADLSAVMLKYRNS